MKPLECSNYYGNSTATMIQYRLIVGLNKRKKKKKQKN